MKLNIYSSPSAVAYALISYILRLMEEHSDKTFNIAFSGGTTPAIMFDLWAHEIAPITSWDKINIWWVDERCVPPEDAESNYGLMNKLLLSAASIPAEHIFRIRGEDEPEKEALRYSKLVDTHIPKNGAFPAFDVVILGVGSDGHTSSIFPGQEDLLSSSRAYEVSEHPESKQKRIALTGPTIMNATHVIFLVTGKDKAAVVSEMYTSEGVGPAAYIAHHANNVELFMDRAAASDLGDKIVGYGHAK